MFSIFRKFFKPTEGKPAPAPPAAPTPAARPPAAPARRAPSAEPSATGAAAPSVEVAHLSLAAIVSRFPEDLKPLVLAPPSNAATISFPVQLIQKQLATGSVKMSLASLHRQAPPGVFGPLAPGDWLRLLRATTVHVYLTVPFVLSWSLIEAMAAGCCIVGSDTAPVRETIDDGVHGLLADMRAPASLADRIATALDDAGLRSRLGRAARDRAVARYALSDRLPEHRALVHAVAARHGNGLKRLST